MKSMFKYRALVLFTSAVLIVTLFSKCDKKSAEKPCCEGYTGKITNPAAESLMKKCNFIPQDSIVDWTTRYQRSKKERSPGILPDVGDVLGDSTSFKSCIVKKIICDENCIGLRVVYGMSPDRKIHVILVGIKPDYSTLYIKEPEECCDINAKQAQSAAAAASGKVGGAEYGQMP